MLVVDSGSILVLSPPIHSGNFHRMPAVPRFKMLNNRSRFCFYKVSFLQSSIPAKFVLLTNAGCYTVCWTCLQFVINISSLLTDSNIPYFYRKKNLFSMRSSLEHSDETVAKNHKSSHLQSDVTF